jgi:lysophospholipase L1-like esterase
MCTLLAAVLPLSAQQGAVSAVPDDQQVMALYERCLQLIEASGVASPELGRAGVPLAENMRQTLESLKFLGIRNPQLHYKFMTNLRAFVLISDTVPKPVPFPEIGRQQLAELRDDLGKIELYFQQQIANLQAELRSPDRDEIARYRDANSSLVAPDPKNPRVVFYGDSITDFWRLNEYFSGKDFVNRGISGQITSQMLARFQADVVNLKPAAVVILAGTNDIGRGVNPTIIQNNLTMICDLADLHKIKVVLASILPVSDHHKQVNPMWERTKLRPSAAILEMNKWLRALCEKRGYTYLDYFPAMAGADGQLAPNLADDGLHPNPSGYRIMAPLAAAAIEKALGAANPAQPAGRKRRLF